MRARTNVRFVPSTMTCFADRMRRDGWGCCCSCSIVSFLSNVPSQVLFNFRNPRRAFIERVCLERVLVGTTQASSVEKMRPILIGNLEPFDLIIAGVCIYFGVYCNRQPHFFFAPSIVSPFPSSSSLSTATESSHGFSFGLSVASAFTPPRTPHPRSQSQPSTVSSSHKSSEDENETKEEEVSKQEPSPEKMISQCACGRIQLRMALDESGSGLRTCTEDSVHSDDTTIKTSNSSAIVCHCPQCRKFHTSAMVWYLPVSNKNIDVVATDPTTGQETHQAIPPKQPDLQSRTNSENPLMLYQDTCRGFSSLGSKDAKHPVSETHVERILCRHCSSKLATRIVADDDTIKDDEKPILVNMGLLVDSTIPTKLQEQWRESEPVSWNSASRAAWAYARPSYTDEDVDEYQTHSLTTSTATESTNDNQETPSLRVLEGGCACGASRYRMRLGPEEPATELQHCYCRLCRQLSGSLCMTWLPVYQDDFSWITDTKGPNVTPPPLIRTTSHGQRHICPSW